MKNEVLEKADLSGICLFDRGQAVEKAEAEKVKEIVSNLGFDDKAANRLIKLMEVNDVNYIFTTAGLTAIDGKVDKKLYGKLLRPSGWYRTRLQVTSSAVKTLPAVLNSGGKLGAEGHRDTYTGFTQGKKILWLGARYENGSAYFLGYSYDAALSKDMENAAIIKSPYAFSLYNLRPKANTAVERQFVDNTNKQSYVSLSMPLTFDRLDIIDPDKQADKGAVQKNITQLNESEEENEVDPLTKEEITEIISLAMKTSNDTLIELSKTVSELAKSGEETPEQEWEKEKALTLSAYKTAKLGAANLGKKPEELLSLVPGTTVKEIDEQVLALQAMREAHSTINPDSEKKKNEEDEEIS